MSSTSNHNNSTFRRGYKRSKTTTSGDFVMTECEELNMELSSNDNHNSNNNTNNDTNTDNQDVNSFLDESDDNDIDIINERELRRNNQLRCDNMNNRLLDIFGNQRIVDPIRYFLLILAWYCNTCSLGGVIRCGVKPSNRFTTRAIRDHILSQPHYKHSDDAVKRLIDAYKERVKRMLRLLFTSFIQLLCFVLCDLKLLWCIMYDIM